MINIFNKIKSYKKIIAVIIISAVILSGAYLQLNKSSAEEAFIVKIIDGDTMETASGDTLRLLGIDTPEIYWESGEAEYFAWEAKNYSSEKLLKKNVELEFDQEKKDQYGRMLVYLFYEGENFNKKLLEKGYASLMIIAPNNKYKKEFRETAEEARKENRGIWNKIKTMSADLPEINYKEAENHYGYQVIVKGKIVDTAQLDNITFLNFSYNYRETLSIVIFSNSLSKFAYQPAEYLKGKKVKILGKIEMYDGAPQIIVEDPENIYVN